MSDNKVELDDINSSKEHKQNLAENSTEDKDRKGWYGKGQSTSTYWQDKVAAETRNQNQTDNIR